jgi:hypothetical protein
VADTEVVRLHGRQAPGAKRAEGGCLIAFGLPFVGVGGSLLALAVQTGADTGGPGLWALFGAGVVFGGAGLWLATRGLGAVRGALRRERSLRAHPDEPWLADHWDPSGLRERHLGPALGSLAALGLLAAVLAPFNWMAWRQPGFVKAVVGSFDLLLVVGLTAWSYKLVQSIKYGAVRARFVRFPFFLGETLDLALDCRGGFERLESLAVTLRHIHVVSERVGRSQRAVHYQHWADSQRFDGGARLGGGELRVSFQLPAGDYGTRLDEEQPRYWELELAGRAPGIDLAARFPVPVYARP